MSNKASTYSHTGISNQVIAEICTIAKKCNVQQVTLFGSRAKGTWRKGGDIDLAVQGGNFAQFSLEVDEDTSTLLCFDFVDVCQPTLKEALKNSIVNEGVVLYEQMG